MSFLRLYFKLLITNSACGSVGTASPGRHIGGGQEVGRQGRLDSFGSFSQIAAAVDRLDVLGMVVAPGSAHALGLDMVGDGVIEVPELLPADRASPLLLPDFALKQTPHLRRGAALAITARMMRIFDSLNRRPWPAVPGQALSTAAEERMVNGTELVATQFHNGILQFRRSKAASRCSIS